MLQVLSKSAINLIKWRAEKNTSKSYAKTTKHLCNCLQLKTYEPAVQGTPGAPRDLVDVRSLNGSGPPE